MNNIYEVCFSVRNPDGTLDSGMSYLVTQVSAFDSGQARAMIEGQYGGRAEIHTCILRG